MALNNLRRDKTWHCDLVGTLNPIPSTQRLSDDVLSRIRSFHCHQVRSKRERHLPLAARFAGNIRPRINSPGTASHTAKSSSVAEGNFEDLHFVDLWPVRATVEASGCGSE